MMALAAIPPARAEKYLCLEMVTAVVVRFVWGLASAGDLYGPSAYVPILVTYGFLALVVMVPVAAGPAAIFGAIVLAAVLLQATPVGKKLAGTTVGSTVTGTLANYSAKVAGKPPTTAAASATKPAAGAKPTPATNPFGSIAGNATAGANSVPGPPAPATFPAWVTGTPPADYSQPPPNPYKGITG
jgi:hypothetical protein